MDKVEARLRQVETAVEDVRRAARQEWLTIKGAAEVTAMSPRYIRRAVKRGELPASNCGSVLRPCWRISRADITAFMDTKKAGTVAVPARSEISSLTKRYFG